MSDKLSARIIGGLFAFVFLLALGAVRSSWTEDEAVRVKSEEQAAQRIDNNKKEDAFIPGVREQPPTSNGQASEKEGEASEDASEFWPTILGKHLKITDTLLVLFTAILAWKTWGLDAATRKLWLAGERQIKHIKTSADATLQAAKASEQQAFAAIAARLPLLRFEPPELHRVDEIIRDDGPFASVEIFDQPRGILVVPSILVRNDGESDAEIQILYIGWMTSPYRVHPMYEQILYALPPVASGQTQIYDTGPFHIIISNEDSAKLHSGKGNVCLYICIEYRDFTGCVWRENAAWIWRQLHKTGAYAFIRDYEAPAEYNQKQKIWDSSGSAPDWTVPSRPRRDRKPRDPA